MDTTTASHRARISLRSGASSIAIHGNLLAVAANAGLVVINLYPPAGATVRP